MPAIMVVSIERYSGKSSIVVGIALELRDRGYSVGYMKPVGAYPIKVDNKKIDEDAYFVREALGLDDDLSDMSPYSLTWENLTRYMRKTPGNPRRKVKACYDRLAGDKDFMLIEGAQNIVHGGVLSLQAMELSSLLDAGVILLDTFNEELTVDRILSAKDYFHERYLGVIENWVPQRRMSFTGNLLARYMENQGIKLFGSVPIDKVLRSITVGDLSRALDGEIICALEKRDELIESMMVGAMGLEHSLRLFRKRSNKVVITGGDRSDIQLAALETPTKSLILTGGHRPSSIVVGQAEEMGVPIIIVPYDTATTVEMVETAIGHQKVHNPDKVKRVRKLVRENLDLDAMIDSADRPGL